MAVPGDNGWWSAPHVSWRFALLAGLFWACALVGFDETQIARDLDSKVTRPLMFRVRQALGRSPALDGRLKVFGIDDSTVSFLGDTDLSLPQWAKLFANIAQAKPQAIVVDKLFAMVGGSKTQTDEAELAAAIQSMEGLTVPVIVGSFVAPTRLRYRQTMGLDRLDFFLPEMVKGNTQAEQLEQARKLNLPLSRSTYLYGPDPRLSAALPHVGHILYAGDHTMIPYLRISAQHAIPHISFLLAPERRFVGGELVVSGRRVPVDRQGVVPINFSDYGTYLRRTMPLQGNVEAAMAGTPPQNIEAGDVVYIIPQFYTGNTDFKITPFGSMPGGYSHLAVMNSILTGRWLNPIGYQPVAIVLASLLGALLGLLTSATGFVVGIGVGLSLILGSVLAMFSYGDQLFDGTLGSLGYVFSASTVMLRKLRVREQKSSLLRAALDGLLAPVKLDQLTAHPEQARLEARERVVTIMFIDVVGFSLVAEEQMPRRAFETLKEVLAEITTVVHTYDGTVNKNLGDGLLCYFGYQLATDEATTDHAERAVACAVQIQKDNLPRTIHAHTRNEPIYPLRIGIHTASVFLGNMGTDSRIDFTLVGNGVNYAKRLETVCDSHAVLLSATTKELLDPASAYFGDLIRRMVSIKHHNELIATYQFDPYKSQPELRQQAISAYDGHAKQARARRRWMVEHPGQVIASSTAGKGILVSYSLSGISLRLDQLLPVHNTLLLGFDSIDGRLAAVLQAEGWGLVAGEVRWSQPEGDRFLHGIQFINLDEDRAALLVEQLRHFSTVALTLAESA